MQLCRGKKWFFYQTGGVQNERSLGGMLKKDYFGFTSSRMSERGIDKAPALLLVEF